MAQTKSLLEATTAISISVAEYARLKDIETRFAIIKEQMLKAEYCPIHTQVILGIEQECAERQKQAQELKLDLLPIASNIARNKR